jgi:hypothetical protein
MVAFRARFADISGCGWARGFGVAAMHSSKLAVRLPAIALAAALVAGGCQQPDATNDRLLSQIEKKQDGEKQLGIGVVKQDQITTIFFTDPDLNAQAALLARLQQTPIGDPDRTAAWIEANKESLTPPFLFELARRRFEQDKKEGVTWYALAITRASYDAARCKDPRARGAVGSAAYLARSVQTYIASNLGEYAQAGEDVVARPDLFAGKASPWWACSQIPALGLAAMQGQKITPEQWLKPESEWPTIQERLRTNIAAAFRKAGEPLTDPVKTASKSFPVRDLPSEFTYFDAIWIDSERLAIATSPSGAQKPSYLPPKSLSIWNEKTKERQSVADQIEFNWCAGHGNISYEIDARDSSARTSDSRPQIVEMFGPPGNVQKVGLAEISKGSNARTLQDGGYSGPDHLTIPYRQSGIDCRWVVVPRDMHGFGSQYWIPLLPGDGILAFEWALEKTGKPTAFYFRDADAAAEPKPLDIDWPGLAANCVRYYAYRKAYFISICGFGRTVIPLLAKETCVPGWWFDPKTARLDRECGPVDTVTTDMIAYEPSRVGLIRYVTLRGRGLRAQPGGIYLTTPDGDTERIATGAIYRGRVSPDGCKIAFLQWREPMSRHEFDAKVLTLCE